MKKMLSVTFIIVCAFAAVLSGCTDSRRTEDPESQSSGSDSDKVQEFQAAEDEAAEQNVKEEETMDRKMIVEVGGKHFTATLEDNKAAETLAETEEMAEETAVSPETDRRAQAPDRVLPAASRLEAVRRPETLREDIFPSIRWEFWQALPLWPRCLRKRAREI